MSDFLYHRINEDFLDSEDVKRNIINQDDDSDEYIMEPEEFDTCLILCMNTLFFFNRYTNALHNMLMRYTSKFRIDVIDAKQAKYYKDD